jgi:Flp pilus assembly protein TadG
VGNLLHNIRILMDRRGEELVEFAMVLPLFLLLMFAVIDMGRYYFVRETLENAVRQAGRYAITGAHTNNLTRVLSIDLVASNSAAGLDTTAINISSAAVGSSIWSNNWAGAPGDNVKISLTTTIGFFTPGIARYFVPSGSNTFTVAVTFRNENFPPSLTQ